LQASVPANHEHELALVYIQLPIILSPLSLEFLSLRLEGLHVEWVLKRWKDAAKHTKEIVALSYATGVTTLEYFQITNPNASWWRAYREDPGMSGSIRVVEIDEEDGMNARDFFDWKV